MKKFLILFAAVAMIAITACNEKPAKETKEQAEVVAANNDKAMVGKELLDTNDKKNGVINVQKAQPTADGKDHTVAEFNTSDYQIRLENLADGNFRLSLWKPGADKSGKPDQEVKTKKCVMQKDNYLMKANDGQVYLVKSTPGSEELTIMNQNKIIYHGTNGK